MQNKTENFLPPEWVTQSAIMLTWPHENNEWRPSLFEVEKTFIAIVEAVVNYESLIISCLNEAHQHHITLLLSSRNIDLTKMHFYVVPSNDAWARDHGPLTVINAGERVLLNFKFNGWGQKCPYELDNQITLNLHQQKAFSDMPIHTIDYVLEGGSIEVDGQGTLMTTESCLLSEKRNTGYKKETIEKQLKKWFGVDRVLWLKHGHISGDDTDGHIDTLARFTDESTIAYVHCEYDHDEHYAELLEMEKELKTFRDYRGEPYRLIPLPWPTPKYSEDGRRLAATYANFLIINGAVLMPVYDDQSDEKALKQIKLCFPDREIIPVPCRYLIEQNGSLHCVTMQLPL